MPLLQTKMAPKHAQCLGLDCLFGKWTFHFTRSPTIALSHPIFGWEGSPTKIDYRKKGTLIRSSLLEDLS